MNKVLIVDDDIKSIKLLKDLLELKKLEVTSATNGKQALELISSLFKFCILDIKLPYADGYTVAREIKSRYPYIKLVAHTASVLKDDKDKLRDTGLFDALMLKPIKLANFNKIIDEMLE